MDLVARLAELGLVHCDFNEFNVLVRAAILKPGITPAHHPWLVVFVAKIYVKPTWSTIMAGGTARSSPVGCLLHGCCQASWCAPLEECACALGAHDACFRGHAGLLLGFERDQQLLTPVAQVDDDDEVTLIDFPQMISVSHANAKELFDRDVDCLIR